MIIETRKRRFTGKRAIVVLVIVFALVGVAIALNAFIHYFPGITVTPAPSASFLTANCGTSAASPLTASPTSVVAGTGGLIRFSCGAAGAALTVQLTGGTATPTFTLPSGYEAGTLNIVFHDPTGCPAQPPNSGIGAISSGTPFTFNANMVTTQFDYCAYIPTSTGAGAVSGFTVSWA